MSINLGFGGWGTRPTPPQSSSLGRPGTMSSGVPLGTQAARESSGSRRSIRPFRATPLSPTTARRVSRSGSSMGGARTWRVQVSDAAGHVDVFTIVAPTSRSAEQAAEVRFLDNGHLGHGGLKIDECRVQC